MEYTSSKYPGHSIIIEDKRLFLWAPITGGEELIRVEKDTKKNREHYRTEGYNI